MPLRSKSRKRYRDDPPRGPYRCGFCQIMAAAVTRNPKTNESYCPECVALVERMDKLN
jgi:hypothetical protein